MTALHDKIAEANTVINTVLRHFRKPALMWSSGKDSMVLLALLHARNAKLPVIFHRHPWQPEKYEFAEAMIRQYKLVVHDWPPIAVTLARHGDGVEILNHYPVSSTQHFSMPLSPIELPQTTVPINRPYEGMACGLNDVLGRPRGGRVQFPWDVVLLGHKASDADSFFGAIPIEADIVPRVNAPTLAFPLRQWTDADVWDVSEHLEVPQQENRYKNRQEISDKTWNPDYVTACTRCLNPAQPETVFCPKLSMNIANISRQFQFTEVELPDYIKQVDHAV